MSARRPGGQSLLEGWRDAVTEAEQSLEAAFDRMLADPRSRRLFLGIALAMGGMILLGLLGMLVVGWAAFPVFFIPIPVCLWLMWGWKDRRIGHRRATRRLWQAAEGGDLEAQFQLGLAYERGDGDHPQEAHTARNWYRRAAEAGHIEASYRLGEMLAWGQGGLKDRPAAQRWLSQAAGQGHPGAKARLAELEAFPNDAK